MCIVLDLLIFINMGYKIEKVVYSDKIRFGED